LESQKIQQEQLSMKIRKNDGLLVSAIAEEMVIMSTDNEQYYTLDEVGSRIWQLLDEEVSVDGLCSRLLSEYDVDDEVCRAEVTEFLNKMSGMDLITLEE
jgi:hypothetical protein